MFGLDSLFGPGGGGLSASSSAASGPASAGNVGVQIGGIQTGGSQGVDWRIVAAAGLAIALVFLMRK